MKRGVLAEVGKNLETANLLTDDVKEVLDTMVFSIKTNKKVKKEKKPRFSGYHLFMKEYRVTVKEENPEIKPQELTSIVSKAWKSVDDDTKKDFNDRASANKEEYFLKKKSSLENDDSSGDEKVDKKGVKEKKEKVVKEKKENKEKVVKEKKEKVVKEKKEKVVKEKKEKGGKKQKAIEKKKNDENIVQEVVVEAEPEKVFDEPEEVEEEPEEEEETIPSPPDSEDEEENADSDIDL
jgi:hypothetical protein